MGQTWNWRTQKAILASAFLDQSNKTHSFSLESVLSSQSPQPVWNLLPLIVVYPHVIAHITVLACSCAFLGALLSAKHFILSVTKWQPGLQSRFFCRYHPRLTVKQSYNLGGPHRIFLFPLCTWGPIQTLRNVLESFLWLRWDLDLTLSGWLLSSLSSPAGSFTHHLITPEKISPSAFTSEFESLLERQCDRTTKLR